MDKLTRIKMNWENIKEKKCPKCSNKLKCRVFGNEFQIKSRKKFKTSKKENWYFCSRCEGFQIGEKKLSKLILKQPVKKTEIPEKDRHLFKTGLLSL